MLRVAGQWKVATLKRSRQEDEHRPASESIRPEQEHEMLSQAETLRFGGSVRNLSLELAAAAPEAVPAEASGEAPPAEATEAPPAVEEPEEAAEAPPVPPAEIPWGEPREAVPVEAVPPGEEPAEDGGDGHAQEAQEITRSGWPPPGSTCPYPYQNGPSRLLTAPLLQLPSPPRFTIMRLWGVGVAFEGPCETRAKRIYSPSHKETSQPRL